MRTQRIDGSLHKMVTNSAKEDSLSVHRAKAKQELAEADAILAKYVGVKHPIRLELAKVMEKYARAADSPRRIR